MAAVGTLSPILVGRMLRRLSSGLGAAALLTAANLALLLSLVMVFSGPGLFLDIPRTRVQGIFFAEWKFVVFYFYVGLPFSLVSAILHLWSRGRVDKR